MSASSSSETVRRSDALLLPSSATPIADEKEVEDELVEAEDEPEEEEKSIEYWWPATSMPLLSTHSFLVESTMATCVESLQLVRWAWKAEVRRLRRHLSASDSPEGMREEEKEEEMQRGPSCFSSSSSSWTCTVRRVEVLSSILARCMRALHAVLYRVLHMLMIASIRLETDLDLPKRRRRRRHHSSSRNEEDDEEAEKDEEKRMSGRASATPTQGKREAGPSHWPPSSPPSSHAPTPPSPPPMPHLEASLLSSSPPKGRSEAEKKKEKKETPSREKKSTTTVEQLDVTALHPLVSTVCATVLEVACTLVQEVSHGLLSLLPSASSPLPSSSPAVARSSISPSVSMSMSSEDIAERLAKACEAQLSPTSPSPSSSSAASSSSVVVEPATASPSSFAVLFRRWFLLGDFDEGEHQMRAVCTSPSLRSLWDAWWPLLQLLQHGQCCEPLPSSASTGTRAGPAWQLSTGPSGALTRRAWPASEVLHTFVSSIRGMEWVEEVVKEQEPVYCLIMEWKEEEAEARRKAAAPSSE